MGFPSFEIHTHPHGDRPGMVAWNLDHSSVCSMGMRTLAFWSSVSNCLRSMRVTVIISAPWGGSWVYCPPRSATTGAVSAIV